MNPIVVPAIIALVGGVIGYFLKFYLDKKAQFASRNAEFKREAYMGFVETTSSFFINSKAAKIQQSKIVDSMAKFYQTAVLYASPDVLNTYADYMQFYYRRNNEGKTDRDMEGEELYRAITGMTEVYRAMRKDIGLSNRGLGEYGEVLLRPIITDYDSVLDNKGKRGQNNQEDAAGETDGVPDSGTKNDELADATINDMPKQKNSKGAAAKRSEGGNE